MTPIVQLIGNQIRVGPLILSCDQALVVAHRVLDLLSPSFVDPDIPGVRNRSWPTLENQENTA